MKDLNYKKDSAVVETMSGPLQMSYRVEQAWVSDLQPNQPVVVGWVRKVNHGPKPWLFFTTKNPGETGWLRFSESFKTLAELKCWASRFAG